MKTHCLREGISRSHRSSARQRAGAFGGGALAEGQFAFGHADLDRVALVQDAFENFFGERIFEETLYGTAHRTRPVSRVVTFLDKEILGWLVEYQVQLLAAQPLHDLLDFEI